MDSAGSAEAISRQLELARRWLGWGVRAAVVGPVLAVLSLSVNLVLFVASVAALAVIPVFGLGIVAFPAVTHLVRMAADVHRRIAPWFGVDIPRPYRPAPSGSARGPWGRFRRTVTDPATWLDLAWLVPGAITGGVLGVVAFSLPAYGLEGVLHIALLLYLVLDWYGYGVFWPMTNAFQAWMSVPQGSVLLVGGLVAARWLLWLHVRFARFFLAPTRSTELTRRVRQLTDTRAEAVDSQAAELQRIERDLHDGAQARLVSLSMNIGLAEELLRRDPDAALRLLAEARESSGAALVELRHLVRGIHPPVLAERGLDGAVRAVALTVPARVRVDIDLPGRLPTPVESASYFAVAEALTNVAKHSSARAAWVHMRHTGEFLSVTVGDDGVGGADPSGGTGLRGIERRLAAFDGTIVVSSPSGGPTVVTMELPCRLSSPKTSPSSGTG